MANVIIIGGGAAGMMAAGTAVREGHDVTVLEHSRKTLLKLGITGKGRCNLTNDCDVRGACGEYAARRQVLYGAFFTHHGAGCDGPVYIARRAAQKQSGADGVFRCPTARLTWWTRSGVMRRARRSYLRRQRACAYRMAPCAA